MKAKTALWALFVALSIAGGWPGNCFGQSDSVPASGIEVSPAPANNPGPFAVAAASPNFMGRLDSEASTPGGAGGYADTDESEPAAKTPAKHTSSKIGIGIKLSSLGPGIEVATPLAGKLNLRGGFNFFRYSRIFHNDGITYDGALHLQSGEAHLDWFPIGDFHVSPGLLFYNGNNVSGTAAVPGGQNFTLGGTQYQSDPAVPVTGTGNLDFVKVAPSIMVGIGNLIPRNGRHFSFLAEIGGAYQGSARVNLNLAGNVCDPTGTICRPISSDPTVQANITAQQQKIQNDVNPFRFFPVVSVGFGFNF